MDNWYEMQAKEFDMRICLFFASLGHLLSQLQSALLAPLQ